jgi:hypothetical protein
VQPTTVPTIMRLSVIALFIALPAAVYAAVSPLQRSTDPEVPGACAQLGEPCEVRSCCKPYACDGIGLQGLGVCLTFAPIHVGY